MDNVPTQTAGTSELLASDWNTYVRDNFDSIKFGHVVVADATARTNLGNVAEGVMVYQSDNNKVYVNSNGTTANWVEVADLDNTGAVSDDAADYLDQYAVQSRNVIINGAMQVAQRATSKASLTGEAYSTADRWISGFNSFGTWTDSVENDAPTGSGFRKSRKLLVTTADASPAAGDYGLCSQRIEGQNLQHFLKGTSSAKKWALSFWVKSNVTGTYIVSLEDSDNTRFVSASYSVSASATWEKKTIVFPADTTGALNNDNGTSITLHFWLGAGSNFTTGTLQTTWAGNGFSNVNNVVGQTNVAAATNNYWQVTGVQLEAGDVVTPFEFEPYETTLRKCQRYYEKSFAIDQDPTDNPTNKRGALHTEVEVTKSYALFPSVVFRVEKRGTPTMTFFNPQTTTAGQACNVNSPYSAVPVTTSIGAASNSETTSGFSIGVNNSSVTGGNQLMVHWVASAEL